MIWRFLWGDTPVQEFEQWVYNEKTLERTLGPEFHLELISASFKNGESIQQIKAMLREFAMKQNPSSCRCSRICSSDVIDMGEHEDFFLSLEKIRDRGDPYWWLSAYRCRDCDSTWLIAQEERQNDVFCVHRLSRAEAARLRDQGAWPMYFDRYETLLRMGLEAGRRVRFVDPSNSSLRYTIEDLARERPGISVSELATLLNLEEKIAKTIARHAVTEAKVKIDFDV